MIGCLWLTTMISSRHCNDQHWFLLAKEHMGLAGFSCRKWTVYLAKAHHPGNGFILVSYFDSRDTRGWRCNSCNTESGPDTTWAAVRLPGWRFFENDRLQLFWWKMLKCMQHGNAHRMPIINIFPWVPFATNVRVGRALGGCKIKDALEILGFEGCQNNNASGWGWPSSGHLIWKTPLKDDRRRCNPPT